MAIPDINARLRLLGNKEFLDQLKLNTAAGERMGNQIRAALLAIVDPARNVTDGINGAAKAHAGLSAQGQAAFHSMRSVTEQLALGVSPATALTQQLNHLAFAATGPGGISGAFGELTAGLRAFITPTTAAVAGFAALAAGIALLVSRASDSQNAAKQFDVILQGMHRNTTVTGKDLEAAAHRLGDVGVSAGEARDAFKSFLREGGDPRLAEQVRRTAANIGAVLGSDAVDKFVSAAAQGGEPLREFAKQLGVIPKIADDTQKQLDEASKSTAKFNDSVSDVLRKRNLSITDQQRQLKQDLFDLTRQRGTQEEELVLASNRRIQEINRQANQAINELAIQRNKESAAQLAAYNKQIEDSAQQALDTGRSLFDQIEAAVAGKFIQGLTPFQEAVVNMRKAWNDMLDTLAKSDAITSLVTGIGDLTKSITAAIKWIDDLSAAIKAIPNLPPWLSGGKFGFLPFVGIGGAAAAQAAGLFADGGLVRGPGTTTSDSILARLSDQEFVSRARSVQVIGADVYAALNAFPERFANLRQVIAGMRHFADGGLATISDRVREAIAVPHFAAGGLVTAPVVAHGGAGRSGFTIVLDGKSFRASADRGVAESLHRTARQQQIVSAGRKPGYHS